MARSDRAYPAPRTVCSRRGPGPVSTFRRTRPDQHVDRIGDGIEVVVPDPLQDLAPAHHPVRIAHQVLEQSVLAGGEPDRVTRPAGGPAGGVEFEVGQAKDNVQRLRGPAGQRPEPGQQLLDGERLGEVVVGAGVEAR